MEGTAYDELYAIPITTDGTAHREGIKRMAIGPEDANSQELLLHQIKNLFLTVQHPSANNPAPFNTGTVCHHSVKLRLHPLTILRESEVGALLLSSLAWCYQQPLMV